MTADQEIFSGWGRFRAATASAIRPTGIEALATATLPAASVVPRGLGRSYGDAAQLAGGTVVLTTGCNRVDWRDRNSGLIRADAGVSIGQLIDRFAPKGWFVPVTPGTRHVTVGGAIAADIHGKNHHVDGSFCDHVRSMRIRLASDEIITLAPDTNADLFWATVGGMGLTGIVIDADIQLTSVPSTTVAVETQRLGTLDDLLDKMRRSDDQHVFSVAWVDLLGNARSVLTQGSFATPHQIADLNPMADGGGLHRQPNTPSIGLPPVPLPRVAITPGAKAFNELWWRKAPSEPTITGQSITAFFHPLDAISDWNRVYGATGFVQWQCVVPDEAVDTLQELVDRFARLPSYFTVLKRLGPGNQSPLSFPNPGWTLAVDLPATGKTLGALGSLDAVVAAAGGRIYLAKDARMQRRAFEAMYPRLDAFRAIRAQVDPTRRFTSDLALRLNL